MAEKVKVSTYAKNVAKSFGYALGDIFSETNPVIKSIASETKSTAEDIYTSIKDFASSKSSSTDEKALTGKVKDTISDAWNNMKEDLSTGQWYNKERQNRANDEMLKAMGFDMDDLSFDMDDEDWGDFSDDELTKAEISSDTKNTAAVITAMDGVGASVANTVSSATVESASYIVTSSNKASKALYDLNTRGFASINRNMANLNDTISAFSKISEPLTQHMQNAALFYSNANKLMSSMEQTLFAIQKNTTPAPLATNNSKVSYNKGTFSDIFSADGTLSIQSYKDMIKENFKDSKDMLDMGMEVLKGMGGGGSGSAGKNISIMQFGTQMITKVLIPKMFRESMKSFNETLKYAISGGIQKARNSDNIVISLLGDLFLPKDGYRDKARNSTYNKGQVAWDGKSRKALVEVIPTLLSNILSAINGDEVKAYDYEKGEFRTAGNIRAEFERKKQRSAQDAGGDFRDSLLEDLREEFKDNETKRAELEKEIEKFFYKSFTSGKGYTDVMLNNFDYASYGLSLESWNRIRNRITKNRQGGKHRNDHLKFAHEVQTERDSFGNSVLSEEASGDSIYGVLNNGLFGSNGKKGNLFTDEFGRTQISYLREIALYSSIIAGGGGRKGGKKGLKYNPKTGTLDMGATESNGGEKTKAQANTSSNDFGGFTDADMQDVLNREAEEQETNKTKDTADKAKGKLKGWMKKVKDFFDKDNPNGLNAMYNKPWKAAANFINKVGLSMDKLIFGDEAHEGGLLGLFKEKMNNFFKDLADKLKLKEKFNKGMNYLFGEKDEDGKRHGGKFGDARDQFRNTMGNVGSSLGSTAKQFFGKGKFKRNQIDTAAYGRKVTKSGVIAVSEGELIVPSELNPYYHGATNKASQLRNEYNLASKFYGFFAPGGTVGEDQSNQESLKERAKQTKERLMKKYKNHEEGKGHQFIRQGFETIGDGAAKLFSSLFGNGDDAEKDQGIIKKVLSKTLSEGKQNAGAMGAGALLGAGASIITGAVVGPLMGAAIGAGVGLVANSKTMQHIIFGADPETGEINGGLLNKQISEFMMKSSPSIAKGGVIGGTIGMVTGSPIIGALVGGSLGFVKSSEKAQDYLFGKRDENGNRDGGLIPAEFQKKVKTAAPNIAAGMLGGALIGPFGLVGNIIAGGALGFVTSSQKFHEFMFGKDDDPKDKGFAGKLQDKVFGNLETIFANMGNAMLGFGKRLVTSGGMLIKDTISGFLEKQADKAKSGEGFLGKLYKGSEKIFGGLLNGSTNILGGLLGKFAVGSSKYNLKHGYNVFDKTLKRNLTAEERVRARGANDTGKWANFDRNLLTQDTDQMIADLELAQTDRTQREALLKKYGLKGKRSEISSALDLAKQQRDSKLTPEALEKKNDDWRVRVSNIFASIDKNVATLAGGKPSEDSSSIINDAKNKAKNALKGGRKDRETEIGKNDNGDTIIKVGSKFFKEVDGTRVPATDEDVSQASVQEGKYENTASKIRGLGKKVKSKIKAIPDMFGNIHQYEENNQGETTEVKNDSETSESRKKIDSFFSSINKIGPISAGLAGLTGLFGSLKDKLFGNEKDEGVFSKLFSGLFGESGVLTGILSFFTGESGTAGAIVKKVISNPKVLMGSLMTNVIGPGLLIAGLGGKFDQTASALTNDAYNETSQKNARTYEATTKDGESITYKYDENGNKINVQTGQIINDSDLASVSGSSTGRKSFSDKLKENIGRGILTGKASVGSKILGKTAVGKAITGSSLLKDAGNALKSSGDDFAGLVFQSSLVESLGKVATKISPMLAKLGIDPDTTQAMFSKLATKMANTLASDGAKQVAKVAGNVVAVARIAFAVADFTTGYEDARTTLGIVSEPTVPQRILSGCLRLVKNLIPVVGSLIPDSLVIDVFCDYIAPALGVDVDELKNARAEAQDTVDKYNAAKGTNLSVGDFTKQVMKDYTWTERIGNAAKATKEDAKLKASNAINSIKENGLGGAIKNGITGMASDFMTAYKENGGGVAGIFSGVGETFGNMLPGVLGEIAKANMQIKSFAVKGELKNLWTVSLKDFSGGGEDIEGTDLKTAVPSLFSKIIGQMPLIITKVATTPIALLSMLGGKVKDFLSPMIEKIKGTISLASESFSKGEEILKNKGSIKEFLDVSEITDDPENPVGGFTSAIVKVSRIASLPVMIVKSVGRDIGNGITKSIDNTKKSVKGIAQDFIALQKYSKVGDISGLWKADVTDNDEDNPLGGFMKVVNFGQKLSLSMPTLVHAAGNKIKENVSRKIDIVKRSVGGIATDFIALQQYSNAGDLSGLWSADVTDNDQDNPLGGFMKVVNFGQKLSLSMPTMVHAAGNKIKESVSNKINTVKTAVGGIATDFITLQQYSDAGDLSGLWNADVTDNDEGNPLGGFMKVINFSQKLSLSVPTMVHWLGNKIKDTFSPIVDKAKSNHETLNTAIDTIKQFADDGDIGSIWSQTTEFQEGDPLRFIWDAALNINKLFQTAVALFNKILGPIKDTIGAAKDAVSGLVDGIDEKLTDAKEAVTEKVSDVKDTVSEKVSSAKDAIASTASSAWNGLTNWISGGDSGIQKNQRNGFVSQFDSRYKDTKLGNSTVGQKGCGPAVAAMLGNDYGAGITFDNAINYAQRYQDNNGTKISYFRDFLGSKGIETANLPGKNIPQEVMQSLAEGKQVILLGSDKNNTSKKNSPFGPNNHYVIASGIDANGNIIVKDPESNGPKAYKSTFLKNATMGMYTNGSGGASSYDTDTAKKVWAYFTGMGYSPAAVAGLMGNLYAESGMDPTRFQNGGPAAGIAQWENYKSHSGRWAELDAFARKNGYQWSDLDPQLQFINKELGGLNAYFKGSGKAMSNLTKVGAQPTTFEAWKRSTDVNMATKQFEAAFERAGKPHMDNRLKAAAEYYKLYQDSNYTYTPDAPGSTVSTDGSVVAGDDSNPITLSNIMSTIGSAFTSKIGNLFTGNKDSAVASNVSGGVDTAVTNAAVGAGNEKQKALVEKLLGIQGKVAYSMSGPRDPSKGSADCSSTVNWAYKSVTGTDIGNNTGAIISSDATEIVDIANLDKNKGGKNSTGPNTAKLMPGDILLYSRPDASYSSGRPYRVGHVEMYVGNGQRIGHGGGMGPKVTSINQDSSRYIMARRLKGIADQQTASAAGSGLYNYNYGELADLSGGSSGLLMKARPGMKLYNSIRQLSIPKAYSGGDSGMVSTVKSTLSNIASNAKASAAQGSISSTLVEQLLNAIIKVLQSISENTANVDRIYQVLSSYTNVKANASATTAAAAAKIASDSTSNSNNSGGCSGIDANIANLVGTLAAIAKG